MKYTMTLNTLGKLLAIVAGAIVIGCAPPPPKGDAVNRASALRSSSLTASAISDGNWRCPNGDNVLLKDNIVQGGWDYTGNGNYEVCVARDKVSEFRISGLTAAPAICVFPMRAGYANGAGYPQLVADPQCFQISGGPIVATFSPSATINYMVIVDIDHSDALASCLSGPSPCPPHSEGFVQ